MTFNLTTEPWIQVLDHDGTIQEVSLPDAIIHARDYERLAGETQTQNFAILRLILAVLLTIYARVDEEGTEEPIEDAADAFARWGAIWKEGKFSSKVISDYFNSWSERFELFDSERPFGQVRSTLEGGTEYKASKLLGDLSESGHKTRLFPIRALKGKESATPDEAARWLVYINAFDDSGVKINKIIEDGGVKPGTGWLGKIGIIYPEGQNLFETLMYNLMLLDRDGAPWPDPKPAWEREQVRESQRTAIPLPDNLPELFTISSRRISLIQENDKVIGFTSYGGDSFPEINALTEPHTIWQKPQPKKNRPVSFSIRKHDPSRQIWRDFSNILIEEKKEDKIPGIISWVNSLRRKKLVRADTKITFRTCGVIYDANNSSVIDAIGDDLILTTSLIADQGDWKPRIQGEVTKITELAEAAGNMTENIARSIGCSGDDPVKTAYKQGEERIYSLVNIPFKQWIASLNPENEDDMEAKMDEWSEQARKLSYEFVSEQIAEAPQNSYLGRKVVIDEKSHHYSLPEAVNAFQRKVFKLYPKDDKE